MLGGPMDPSTGDNNAVFVCVCVCCCEMCECLFERPVDLLHLQLPLHRSTGGRKLRSRYLAAVVPTPVLPRLLGSGQRKMRHREELLSASPWQLRE